MTIMRSFFKKDLFLKLKPYFLILLTGMLFTANVMMLSNPFLSLVCFFPLFILIGQEQSFKKISLYLALSGIVIMVMGYPWVYSTMISPLLNYGYIKSGIIFVILSLINALPFLLSLGIATYFWKRLNNHYFLLIFPVLYFLLKISIGEIVPIDFIYGFLKENDQFSTFYLSKLIGVHGLTCLILFINCLLYLLVEKKNSYKRLIIFLVSTVVSLEIGGALSRIKNSSPIKKELSITVVQSNSPDSRALSLQYGDQSNSIVINKIKDLISEAANKFPDSDFLMFSESTFPIDISLLSEPQYQEFFNFLSLQNKRILIGGYKKESSGKILNLVFELDGSGIKNIYTKKILMPFGEYIPLAQYKFIREFFNLVDIYNTESEYPDHSFKIGEITYKPIICYESLFSEFLRSNSKDSDILFVLSNNYWSKSEVENIGYLYRSLAAGIELGRPIVISGNSGYSSALDANGEFLVEKNQRKITKLFEQEIMNFKISIPEEPGSTFYGKYSYFPFLIFMILLTTSLIFINRKKS